jgi:ABC-type lipoprotein export system ATPase subunit
MTQTSVISSAIPTPMRKFMLVDMTLEFAKGELSLVCGKLGSGKTLLLLGM